MTFGRAWELLSKNWIIVVPGLIIAVFQGVAQGLIKGMLGISPAVAILSALVLGAVGMIATFLNVAYTTGMAQAAWERGTATLADGARAFQEDGANLLVTVVLLIVLGIVATFFIWLLFVPVLAFWFFFLYAVAAAVVGRHGGIAALQESIQIALARPVPTLIIMAVQLGLSIVVGIIAVALGSAFGLLPIIGVVLGPIVASAIAQLVQAYISLVVVGEYIGVRTPAA